MAKLSVSPTKANLLRLKRDLAFIREGYEMLEQKRQLLVLELMETVESARSAEGEVRERMAVAFAAMRDALVRAGALAIERDAAAVRVEHSARVTGRSIMGIVLPEISAEHPAFEPSVSLLTGTTGFDEAARAFGDALRAIDRLAQVENTVFRLAREVRKTQRRVNALEKIFIPDYSETLAFITGTLDEREREGFAIRRMLKKTLEEKRRNPAGREGANG